MSRRVTEGLHGRLDGCARELGDEMIEFTRQLVAVASENPPGSAYPECLRVIASRLRALGMPCERVPYRPLRGVRDKSGAAVLVSSIGSGKRTLYFSGLCDVVPVTTPGQYTPVLRAKALFGRGTGDMKSGLASMLYACMRSPAKRRSSKCVQVSWRSGSTQRTGCQRTLTALAFLPCPTVPRNSFTPIASLNAQQSTHAQQPPY
jgi:acetylornithine deacetylase/succinyl-diaminopimelate desuccinylase-like protein